MSAAKAPFMPKPQPSLGLAIREARKDASLSISAVARASGIDPAVLSRVESGGRGLRFDTACRIARALGISLDELAGNAGLLDNAASPSKRGARNASVIHKAEALARVRRLLRSALTELTQIKTKTS